NSAARRRHATRLAREAMQQDRLPMTGSYFCAAMALDFPELWLRSHVETPLWSENSGAIRNATRSPGLWVFRAYPPGHRRCRCPIEKSQFLPDRNVTQSTDGR